MDILIWEITYKGREKESIYSGLVEELSSSTISMTNVHPAFEISMAKRLCRTDRVPSLDTQAGWNSHPRQKGKDVAWVSHIVHKSAVFVGIESDELDCSGLAVGCS